jgi:hypothetical protein
MSYDVTFPLENHFNGRVSERSVHIFSVVNTPQGFMKGWGLSRPNEQM